MCDQLGPKPRTPKISKKANSNAVTASQASMPHSGTTAQPVDLNGLSSSTRQRLIRSMCQVSEGKSPPFQQVQLSGASSVDVGPATDHTSMADPKARVQI